MKHFLFAFAALSLAATSALADFVPGRVRPGFLAKLEVVGATGSFENVRSAELSVNYMDGSIQPVSMTLSLPGHAPLTLPILSDQRTGCGNLLAAYAAEPVPTSATIKDYSGAVCMVAIDKVWQVRVLSSLDGAESELTLKGNPEALVMTL